MSHEVRCSRCPHKFSQGVTVIYRFVVFHFCAYCWRDREACNAIMRATCPDVPAAVSVTAGGV